MSTEVEMNMYVFSNIAHDAPAMSLIQMFYDGVLKNEVGIMRARVAGTEDTVLVLVGVSKDEDGSVNCYPLAKILDAEQATYLESPDGLGNYNVPTYTGDAVKEEEAA